MEAMTFQQRRNRMLRDLVLFIRLKCQLDSEKSLEKFFSVIWGLEAAHHYMSPSLIQSEKSEEEANKMRIEGNAYYKEKNYEKALSLYNKSIRFAPHPVVAQDITIQDDCNDEVDFFKFPQIDPARYGGLADLGETKALAMGFANRSAVLFVFGQYEKCLNDITLAFAYGYPEPLHEKLVSRRQKCLSAQNAEIAPTISPNVCRPLSEADINHQDLVETLHCFKIKETPSLRDLLLLPRPKLHKVDEQNPAIPALSTALKMTYTPSRGRGLVAVRDILPGEVLGVERAYYVSIAKDKLGYLCSTCLTLCFTPLPCPACSKVIFCSKSCRDKGLAEEHWIECKILPTLHALNMDTPVLTYKFLKTYTYENVNAISEELQGETCDSPENMGFNEAGIYDSASYRTIAHLKSIEENTSFEDLLKMALRAMVFLKLLEQSGRYFVNKKGEPIIPTEKDYIQTGVALFSIILKSEINGDGSTSPMEESPYLHVIFPAFCLINHSCNANGRVRFSGRDGVLRALQPISAGEEVTFSYITAYAGLEKGARLQRLNSYAFQCQCEACESNWPIFEDMPKFLAKCFGCQNITTEDFLCPSCLRRNITRRMSQGKRRMLESTRSRFARSSERLLMIGNKTMMNQSVSEDDFRFLCEFSVFIRKHLVQPCHSFPLVVDILDNCFKYGY